MSRPVVSYRFFAGLAVYTLLIMFGCFAVFSHIHGSHEIDFKPVVQPNVSKNITHDYSRDVSKQVTKEVSNQYNYDYTNFQANSVDVEYDLDGSVLKIDDVDKCIELFGNSMQPAIWQGNTVCMRDYKDYKDDLEPGQVISFETEENEKETIHTVIGDYEPEGYVKTRGYNAWSMEKVELDEINYVEVATLRTKENYKP